MALLDIFDDDAFSIHSLTAAIDKLPYVPGRIGRMNLFTEKPITTAIAIIEERNGLLALLPAMPRGSDGQTTPPTGRRKIRAVPVPHVPYWDAVRAEDLEGKRSFGSEDQLEVFSQVVNDRLEVMRRDHEATHEWHRLGAIKGIVLDADGSTELVNWFDEFGISPTTVEFDFGDSGDYDNAAPVQDMKAQFQIVKRLIQDALGGTPFTGIGCIAGDTWFDAFVSHASVRRSFERYQENSFARDLQDNEGGFMWNGVTIENYRGAIGNVDFVEDDQAHFFPIGAADVFLEVIAPADFIEAVNTRGQKIYAKQERIKWDKGVELHTQSNVLYVCTRPKALVTATAVNLDGTITTTTAAPVTTI